MRFIRNLGILFFFLSLGLGGDRIAVATKVIGSVHYTRGKAGAKILNDGGNAVDSWEDWGQNRKQGMLMKSSSMKYASCLRCGNGQLYICPGQGQSQKLMRKDIRKSWREAALKS